MNKNCQYTDDWSFCTKQRGALYIKMPFSATFRSVLKERRKKIVASMCNMMMMATHYIG